MLKKNIPDLYIETAIIRDSKIYISTHSASYRGALFIFQTIKAWQETNPTMSHSYTMQAIYWAVNKQVLWARKVCIARYSFSSVYRLKSREFSET